MWSFWDRATWSWRLKRRLRRGKVIIPPRPPLLRLPLPLLPSPPLPPLLLRPPPLRHRRRPCCPRRLRPRRLRPPLAQQASRIRRGECLVRWCSIIDFFVVVAYCHHPVLFFTESLGGSRFGRFEGRRAGEERGRPSFVQDPMGRRGRVLVHPVTLSG